MFQNDKSLLFFCCVFWHKCHDTERYAWQPSQNNLPIVADSRHTGLACWFWHACLVSLGARPTASASPVKLFFWFDSYRSPSIVRDPLKLWSATAYPKGLSLDPFYLQSTCSHFADRRGLTYAWHLNRRHLLRDKKPDDIFPHFYPQTCATYPQPSETAIVVFLPRCFSTDSSSESSAAGVGWGSVAGPVSLNPNQFLSDGLRKVPNWVYAWLIQSASGWGEDDCAIKSSLISFHQADG